MGKIEILGLIAASLTTAAFIPQVYKAWRYKSTKDISIVMYLILLIGLFLWIIYGIYHRSIPILFTNIITSLLVILMIGLKIKHK